MTTAKARTALKLLGSKANVKYCKLQTSDQSQNKMAMQRTTDFQICNC